MITQRVFALRVVDASSRYIQLGYIYTLEWIFDSFADPKEQHHTRMLKDGC